MTKKELALEYHQKGYNCCQAVACSFCKDFGISEQEMFRISEGFGFGMGDDGSLRRPDRTVYDYWS